MDGYSHWMVKQERNCEISQRLFTAKEAKNKTTAFDKLSAMLRKHNVSQVIRRDFISLLRFFANTLQHQRRLHLLCQSNNLHDNRMLFLVLEQEIINCSIVSANYLSETFPSNTECIGHFTLDDDDSDEEEKKLPRIGR